MNFHLGDITEIYSSPLFITQIDRECHLVCIN